MDKDLIWFIYVNIIEGEIQRIVTIHLPIKKCEWEFILKAKIKIIQKRKTICMNSEDICVFCLKIAIIKHKRRSDVWTIWRPVWQRHWPIEMNVSHIKQSRHPCVHCLKVIFPAEKKGKGIIAYKVPDFKHTQEKNLSVLKLVISLVHSKLFHFSFCFVFCLLQG